VKDLFTSDKGTNSQARYTVGRRDFLFAPTRQTYVCCNTPSSLLQPRGKRTLKKFFFRGRRRSCVQVTPQYNRLTFRTRLKNSRRTGCSENSYFMTPILTLKETVLFQTAFYPPKKRPSGHGRKRRKTVLNWPFFLELLYR